MKSTRSKFGFELRWGGGGAVGCAGGADRAGWPGGVGSSSGGMDLVIEAREGSAGGAESAWGRPAGGSLFEATEDGGGLDGVGDGLATSSRSARGGGRIASADSACGRPGGGSRLERVEGTGFEGVAGEMPACGVMPGGGGRIAWAKSGSGKSKGGMRCRIVA